MAINVFHTLFNGFTREQVRGDITRSINEIVAKAKTFEDEVNALLAGSYYTKTQIDTLFAAVVVPKVFKHFALFASVGNVGAGMDTLHSTSFDVNTFPADGDAAQGNFSGTVKLHATATRQIKLTFAATDIFDSGALTIAADSSWSIDYNIIRVSNTVLRYTVRFIVGDTTPVIKTSQGELTGLNLLGTVYTFAIKGESAGVGGGVDNDIVSTVSNGMYIRG